MQFLLPKGSLNLYLLFRQSQEKPESRFSFYFWWIAKRLINSSFALDLEILWTLWICIGYNSKSTITVVLSRSYCDDQHPIGHSIVNNDSAWSRHRLRIIILCHSRIISDDTKSFKLLLLVQFSRFENQDKNQVCSISQDLGR